MKKLVMAMLAVFVCNCGSKEPLPVKDRHYGLASCDTVVTSSSGSGPGGFAWLVGIDGRKVAWTEQFNGLPFPTYASPGNTTDVLNVLYTDTGSVSGTQGTNYDVTPAPVGTSDPHGTTTANMDSWPSFAYNGAWLVYSNITRGVYWNGGNPYNYWGDNIRIRNISTGNYYTIAAGNSATQRFQSPSSSPYGLVVYQRFITATNAASIEIYDLAFPQRWGSQINVTASNGHLQDHPRTDGLYIVYEDWGPPTSLYSIPLIKLYSLATDTATTIGYGKYPDIYSNPDNYVQVAVWINKDAYGHDQVYGYDIGAHLGFNITSTVYDKKSVRVSYDADNESARIVWSEKNSDGDYDIMVSPGFGSNYISTVAGGLHDQNVGDIDGDMLAYTSSGIMTIGFDRILYTYTFWDSPCVE